jgi:hypothetical protein
MAPNQAHAVLMGTLSCLALAAWGSMAGTPCREAAQRGEAVDRGLH